jgi:DNA repair protein RecO (recombination protein O)
VNVITTDALVVRTVAYGESDVIVTLLTEWTGKMSCIVRGGRKSTRRVAGALEPFHTIRVRVDDKGRELSTLREARLVNVRAGIVESLEAVEAAGIALRWARHLCPPRTPEPAAWTTLTTLLDDLDAREGDRSSPRALLAAAGLRLLADVGYALDLERCVSCGKPCPAERAAGIDGARGGLVCAACGGARRVLDSKARAAAVQAQRGKKSAIAPAQAEGLLSLVDEAMAVHADYER